MLCICSRKIDACWTGDGIYCCAWCRARRELYVVTARHSLRCDAANVATRPGLVKTRAPIDMLRVRIR